MSDKVTEVPGLYGNLRLKEKVLQRIWNESAFTTQGLKTDDGQEISLIHPGGWNKAEEGPDFKEASILLNSVEQKGDIEIHFHAKDWCQHGHQKDLNYNRVVLHVCLYPSENSDFAVQTKSGKKIPQLTLLPYLTQGLEEYNEEWTLSALHGPSSSVIVSSAPKKIKQDIILYAEQRWSHKMEFAKKRLDQFGWEHACHQWFLEVLGYPRNRKNMHDLATAFPLETWKEQVDISQIYNDIGSWKVKGIRPVNRPFNRLLQYQDMIKVVPNWTDTLKSFSFPKESNFKETSLKELSIFDCKKKWQSSVLGNTFSHSKANTLLVDSLFPLWAAYHQVNPFPLWYHWPSGDFPSRLCLLASQWGLKVQGKGLSNGIMQGLLQNFLIDPTIIAHP